MADTKKIKSIKTMTKRELASEIFDLNRENGYKNPYRRNKAIEIMVNGLDSAKGLTKIELQEILECLRRRRAEKAAAFAPKPKKPTTPRGKARK